MSAVGVGEARRQAACLHCGYPRSEHSYNGACYGLCADWTPAPEPHILTKPEAIRTDVDRRVINLNERARVRLTETGLAAYRENAEKMRLRGSHLAHLWPLEPKLDADGYYVDQLWCLIQLFGPKLAFGCPSPFLMSDIEVLA